MMGYLIQLPSSPAVLPVITLQVNLNQNVSIRLIHWDPVSNVLCRTAVYETDFDKEPLWLHGMWGVLMSLWLPPGPSEGLRPGHRTPGSQRTPV